MNFGDSLGSCNKFPTNGANHANHYLMVTIG